MNEIRKISVGKDYPNGVIHYQKGKQVNLLGVPYTISDIVIDPVLAELGVVAYNVYIQNQDGTVLWKQISDVPVVIENNISFE